MAKNDKRLKGKLANKVLGQVSAPDLKLVAQYLYHEMGGAEEFAKEVAQCYRASTGMTKTKLMDLMLSVLRFGTDQDAKEDLHQLSEEDLRRVGMEIIENAINGREKEDTTEAVDDATAAASDSQERGGPAGAGAEVLRGQAQACAAGPDGSD